MNGRCWVLWYRTIHADYIYGEAPCARSLTKQEIDGAYEKNTGLLTAKVFQEKDYEAVPAVLCKDAGEAVHNAVVSEEVAKMAAHCELINLKVQPAPRKL